MKLVNKRITHYTHYIGRGSPFGNPCTHLPLSRTAAFIQVPTIEDAVACFDMWVHGSTKWDVTISPTMRTILLTAISSLPEDAVLGCFGCQPRCHGDVIMTLWREMHKKRGAKK